MGNSKRARARWIAAAACGAALAFVAGHAEASEGGASVYLLGSGGPGAAVVPPIEGVFLLDTQYYYSGEASAGREFVIGGNVEVRMMNPRYVRAAQWLNTKGLLP